MITKADILSEDWDYSLKGTPVEDPDHKGVRIIAEGVGTCGHKGKVGVVLAYTIHEMDNPATGGSTFKNLLRDEACRTMSKHAAGYPCHDCAVEGQDALGN